MDGLRETERRAHWKMYLPLAICALALWPAFRLLPWFHGGDWEYFFYARSEYNIFAPNISMYPPYAVDFIRLVIALLPDWRDSLALLHALTVTALAFGVWQAGGGYGAMLLALASPVTLYLIKIGQLDGLVLLGVVTGFTPLVLFKPQIAAWSLLRSPRQWLAGIGLVGLSLIVWPNWWTRLITNTYFGYADNFGWRALGWPLFFVGLALLAGAGRNPYRLMAAGCFLSPYVLPYHLILLLPMLGQMRTRRARVGAWLATFGILPALIWHGAARWLMVLIPLIFYWAEYAPKAYGVQVASLWQTFFPQRDEWLWRRGRCAIMRRKYFKVWFQVRKPVWLNELWHITLGLGWIAVYVGDPPESGSHNVTPS